MRRRHRRLPQLQACIAPTAERKSAMTRSTAQTAEDKLGNEAPRFPEFVADNKFYISVSAHFRVEVVIRYGC
jgi:hypothetical protein